MDVKRCDRCGAIYDTNSSGNGTDFIIVPEKSENTTVLNMFRYNGDNAIAYDVCKHCMASFKHWFSIKDDADE